MADDTKAAAQAIANAKNTKSAPTLQTSPIKKRRPSTSTSTPRSRRTTPRSRRTTPRSKSKSGLSPVGKQKPRRAKDTSFLDRLAARANKKQRPRTAQVACSASGRWSSPGGGRFSTAKPKTETDWIMKRSRETPGPGQYTPKMVRKKSGCKISDANPKSDVDLVMLRSRETPGPSEYQKNSSTNSGKGLKISDANPKSDLEWVIYRAKQSPAPNAYQNPMKRIVKTGGKFSAANPLTETEVLMLRSAETPGPNQYNQALLASGRGATKISDANPKVSSSKFFFLLQYNNCFFVSHPSSLSLFITTV